MPNEIKPVIVADDGINRSIKPVIVADDGINKVKKKEVSQSTPKNGVISSEASKTEKQKRSESLSSANRWANVTEQKAVPSKYKTDDYIDVLENKPLKKKKVVTVQPDNYAPEVKVTEIDAPTEKEAETMMEEDFGKKEFDAYQNINNINKDLIFKNETDAVKELRDKFKGSGFIFEETGIGNKIRVSTSTNGGLTTINSMELDLVSPSATKETTGLMGALGNREQEGQDQYNKLIDFMKKSILKKTDKDFLKKDVKDYGQLVNLMADNPYKYGEEFLNQYDTDRWFDNQYRDLVIESKSLKRDEESLLKQYDEFVKNPTTSEQESEIKNKINSLDERKSILKSKYDDLGRLNNKLKVSSAVYYKNKEKQGNTLGLISKSFMKGAFNIEKALAGTAADIMPYVLPEGSLMPDVQKEKMKAAGMSDTEIKDYASKQLRKQVIPEIEKGLENLVSFGTTNEYIQSKDRGDLEKVGSFLSESIGTALSGGGNPMLQKIAFFSQSYNAIEDEMNSSQFEGLNQFEKKLISVPYAMTIGALENLGFKFTTGATKNPLFNKLVNNIVFRTFSNLPKDASATLMQNELKRNTAAMLANTGLRIFGGALVEGGVEGAQQLDEIAIKNISNALTDKDYFKDVPDITTAKGINEALGAAATDAYYGALGGLIMSAGSESVSAIRDGYSNRKSDDDFAVFANSLKDNNLRSSIESDIKSQIVSGDITKEEAKAQIESMNKSYSILQSIPDNLDIRDQRESFNLILEKQKIQKETEGKDPALVAAQTNRINEINNELKTISENAVQKQTTGEVPVQPEATVGREMEEGKPQAEPQGVTEEGKVAAKEEVKVFEFNGKKYEVINESITDLETGNLVQADLATQILEEGTPIEETVVVEPITKQEQKQNLVTQENVEELRAQQTTPVAQKIFTTAKLAMKALPGVKIYVHNTTNEFDQAIGQKSAEGAKGAYVDGEIHINLENGADVVTMLHESMHHGLVVKGVESGAMTDLARGLKSVISDKALNQRLDDFISGYDGSEQAEEYLAELGGIMAEAKQELTTTKFQQFKNLINKIAQKLGLPTVFSAAANAKNAVDFMNSLTKSIRTGQEVYANDPGDGGEVGTFNIPKVKYQKAKSVSEDSRDFIREFVEDLDIREFNGQKFVTNMYDYTNAGVTDLGNGFKINMLGGKNYVPLMMSLNGKKMGDVSNLAAFNTKAQAETFIRNAQMGGAELFAPHSGTLSQSWQFQQHTFAELFNLVLDNGILTPKQLIDTFNNAIKGNKSNQEEFAVFAKKYGENIENFDSFESDPKKIIELLDIKNNYSPNLRKALNNSISANKEFQKAIGVNNKEEFYKRIMDPLNQGMTGGEIMNVVKFDPNTFEIVQTKESDIDHHPSFGWTLLAKINGIYQPTSLYKSSNVTESYTKYNKDGVEVSRKAEEPKFEQKNVSSSAGAIPKVAEFKGKSKAKFQKIAPNGKPSNLNDKQWEQVRTPEFKKWFGDWENDPKNASKIVDENGEPLVVYHGTRKSFDEFSYDVKPANFRAGALEYSFWFTANKKNSELYGNQVMEVFLNSKNPIEIDYTNPESYREIVVPADKTRAMSIAEFNEKKGNIKHSQMRQGIELRMSEDKSIDGIIHRNIKDVILSDNFQAFNPNQIKSATENVGTFSTETRNIKFQKANLTTDKDAKPGYEAALNALNETEQQREQWRKNNKVNQKQKRNPLVEQAVKDYYNEEITQEEYLDIVSKNQPIKPFKKVPALPSLEEITNALDSNKVATGIIGLTKNLKDGERVASRLDIPAYEDFDTWVVSVHDGNKEGKSIAYGQTAVLKNVDFKTFPGPAIRIAMGTQNKSTIARMFGDWINEDPEIVHARAEELMNDPAWTQVGMNPFRYSWFYDKTDGMPLASADEVIQVGALVLAKNAKKVSPSDPMFETKSAKGGKIKFQKANTQQEAIQKAKEKYTLSVEERGNPHKQGVDAALNDLRKSDWYKTTDDTQRENAERELKAFFGEKLKKAPSVAKILGKPKPKKVTVNEMTAYKNELRLQAKAARDAKGDLNAKRRALATAISGMVKTGKIKTAQAGVLIKRISNLNLDNPVMVERFVDYASKVFDRADYQQRLDDAFSVRKSIRKLLKTDNQAEVSGMAKAFTKIDPSMVEDIDAYIEMAEKVKNAVKPSRVKGLDVVMKEAANIAEISEYTNNEIERQEEIQRKEFLATYDFLDNEMSLKDMQDVINALKDPTIQMDTTEKEKYVKDYLNGRFGIMSSILESMFKTGIDPMTGEKITFDEKQKELIKRALNIDLNEMSVREAIKIVESLENFLTNQITSGLEAAVSSYEGAMNDKQLVQKGFKAKSLKFLRSGYIGRGYTEQLFSLPLMIEKMFGGINRSIEVMNKWGLSKLINGVNKANKQFSTIVDSYMKQPFYATKNSLGVYVMNKGFMDANNVYERGMLAFLKRNLIGTQTEMKAEFERRIKMIRESIDVLIQDGNSKEKKMGELYKEIYDKLNIDSMDMDVINSNASKNNLEAINWWINQWSKHYSDLSDISLSVYNTQLGSDLNYTPDKYKKLSSKEVEFDKAAVERNGSFALSIDYTDKNKSGVLIESTRPEILPNSRYVSLDFDTNNAKALKSALTDINTASAIRQIDGFMSSDSFKKLIPESDDRKIITRRINTYIRRAKGKNIVPSDTMQDVERFGNFVTALGVGKALGGVSQAVTQTVPVMLNTVINAGRFDVADANFNAWLDDLGVSTSNRGLESQSTVESIDRQLEASNGNTQKIIKGVENLSQFYLKQFLSRPDIFVARSSFKSYYLQNLKRRGISTDIDWKTHEPDMEAVEYAEAMVNRQQNVSDPLLAGEFLASDDPMRKISRKAAFPFASFILNQKARMYNDLDIIFSGTSTTEDKVAAARSLAGLAVELATFQLIGFGIRRLYDYISASLLGDEDDEETKKKKMINATKYPVKSIVNDIISPLPGMTDESVTWGLNTVLSYYPWMDDKEVKDAVNSRNKVLELKGEDPMNAEAEAEFIKNMKDEATYQVFEDENDRKWGMYGIALGTYNELFDVSKLATTGEFTDEYQGRETTKKLLEADREKVKYAVPFMIAYSTGLLPKDVGTISKNYINRIKKKAVTEKQYDRYETVQKDLGRNLKSWEIDMVKAKKESETAIDEIKFIERNGGLTERQGREYLKLMKAIGEPTVSDLTKIKNGQTADQILK